MKTEVESPARTNNEKALRSTVEETLSGIFPDGYEAVKEAVLKSSYQCINYVLMHLLPTVNLDSILALTLEVWSPLESSMDAIAHRIAGHRKVLEHIIVGEFDHVVEVAGSNSPSSH